MRVLVVEDETRMAGLLKRALQEEGHAVDVAADGLEGLWLATENAYGAIVLDEKPWKEARWCNCLDAGQRRAPGAAAPTTTWSSRSACWSWPRGCGRWHGGTTGPGR